MSSPHVLLLGGTGQIAKLMTPLMLAKSWNVTSVIRDARQKDSISRLGAGQKGNLYVLVCDLETVKSDEDARKIIVQTKAEYVVFMAGGISGTLGTSSLYAVDRDAAQNFMNAAVAMPSVTKFMMISFPASRRNRAPWWTDSDWKSCQSECSMFPHQANSKVAADMHLVRVAKERKDSGGAPFQAISLRPSWLTNGRPTGKVHLGKTAFSGQVSRADVAAVGVSLLSRLDTNGWYDLLSGKDDIETAVEMAVHDSVNCIDGEDLDLIYSGNVK